MCDRRRSIVKQQAPLGVACGAVEHAQPRGNARQATCTRQGRRPSTQGCACCCCRVGTVRGKQKERHTRLWASSVQSKQGAQRTRSTGRSGPQTASASSSGSSTPPERMQASVRVRSPPHAASHAPSATTCHVAMSHGVVLHSRSIAGAATPSQSEAGKEPAMEEHAMLRRCVPPPHGSEQAPQGLLLQRGALQSTSGVHVRTRAPANAASHGVRSFPKLPATALTWWGVLQLEPHRNRMKNGMQRGRRLEGRA